MASSPISKIRVLTTSANTGRRTNKSVNFMLSSLVYQRFGA